MLFKMKNVACTPPLLSLLHPLFCFFFFLIIKMQNRVWKIKLDLGVYLKFTCIVQYSDALGSWARWGNSLVFVYYLASWKSMGICQPLCAGEGLCTPITIFHSWLIDWWFQIWNIIMIALKILHIRLAGSSFSPPIHLTCSRGKGPWIFLFLV